MIRISSRNYYTAVFAENQQVLIYYAHNKTKIWLQIEIQISTTNENKLSPKPSN